MKAGRRPALTTVVLVLSLLVAGCANGLGAGPAAAGSESEETGPPTDLVGSITLAPSRGLPGTPVTVTGEGLPPAANLTLQWTTVSGKWVLEGERAEEYHGRSFDPVTIDLGTARTDATGALEATFEVPAGVGFGHDVVLVDENGVIRNRALFDVEMHVSVSPTEGPVGTPITIEVHGMGWQTLENTRAVVYDNTYTGWMSAVTTDGFAQTVIPATGTVGPHRIEVLRGAFTFPYLNPEQSPRPDIPVFEAMFTVTDGEPVLPASIEEQNWPAREREAASVPSAGTTSITTDMASGPVGTSLVVSGVGFAPGADVELNWYRIVGNRVSGQGWEEQSVTLGEVTASSDGTFRVTVEVPGDVGGAHLLEAMVDGKSIASTDFVITPAAIAITPDSGPWGSEIKLNLTGVGWTETANIYTLVYDNSYLGYACGFNSQGDVEVTLKATGEPGWHFIDLYPAIYKGEESPGQQNFRIPQLTYADDHPGENLPAFHFAFYLEG
ncbi:MAG: hypothetical protein Q8Q52_05305 [Acidimicrobiia bacterium]|nr:hypothetical protein [Acidimicrobiia bacterium]